MEEKKIKKVFLDGLPRDGRKYIDWKNSIGYNVNGIYNNIKFSIKIIAYNNQKNV